MNHEMDMKTRNICFPASGTIRYVMVIATARQDVTIVGMSYCRPINLLSKWQNIIVMEISKSESVFIKIEGFY
jgi:hypothetical protein